MTLDRQGSYPATEFVNHGGYWLIVFSVLSFSENGNNSLGRFWNNLFAPVIRLALNINGAEHEFEKNWQDT